jgi:hypothetical protein
VRASHKAPQWLPSQVYTHYGLCCTDSAARNSTAFASQQTAAELRHSSGAEVELRKIPRETFPSTFFAGGDSSSRSFSSTSSADTDVAGGLYEALSPPTLFEQYAAAEQARNATLPEPVHAASVSVLRELLGTSNRSTTTASESVKNTDANSDTITDSSSGNGASQALTSVHTSLVLDTVKLVNFGPFHEEVRHFSLLVFGVTYRRYCTVLSHTTTAL